MITLRAYMMMHINKFRVLLIGLLSLLLSANALDLEGDSSLLLFSANSQDSEELMRREIEWNTEIALGGLIGRDAYRFPLEELSALLQEMSEDECYASDFREYAGKRYRLEVIRQEILELLQNVHDHKSAELAAEQILAYDQEMAELGIRQAYLELKSQPASVERAYMMILFRSEHEALWVFQCQIRKIVEDRNLYQYKALKHVLNPRLHSRWGQPFLLPSFYVSAEPIIAKYKEISGGAAYSAELREFAAKCLKLNDIRNKILEAISTIHDEESVVRVKGLVIQYEKEIIELEIYGYYNEIKDKLSEEESALLTKLLRRRYDEDNAFQSRYMQIWEEKELEKYNRQQIGEYLYLRRITSFWTDYTSMLRNTIRMDGDMEIIKDFGWPYDYTFLINFSIHHRE